MASITKAVVAFVSVVVATGDSLVVLVAWQVLSSSAPKQSTDESQSNRFVRHWPAPLRHVKPGHAWRGLLNGSAGFSMDRPLFSNSGNSKNLPIVAWIQSR